MKAINDKHKLFNANYVQSSIFKVEPGAYFGHPYEKWDELETPMCFQIFVHDR
jgi:hypothetical protein